MTLRWIATGMVAVGVTSIAVIYACSHRDDARRPAPPAVGVAGPLRPVTASPSPAMPASAVPAQPGAAIPTVSLPCVDDRTELRIGHDATAGAIPVVCWGDHCIDSDLRAVPTPPAPAPAVSAPAAVVGLQQVCTGARCDPLGPRLRAVLAKIEPGDLRSVTRDHAAIAIQREGGTVEVWNRASDRQIDLGWSPSETGTKPTRTPDGVELIGDFLLVSWGCEEWCSSVAVLLDSRGRPTGPDQLNIRPVRSRRTSVGTSIFAAGDDRFLVFGLFGEVSVIARGRVLAQSLLVSPSAGAIELEARAIPDGDGNMDILWCHGAMCKVSRIAVQAIDAHHGNLRLEDHLVLPRCSSVDHVWPPRQGSVSRTSGE